LLKRRFIGPSSRLPHKYHALSMKRVSKPRRTTMKTLALAMLAAFLATTAISAAPAAAKTDGVWSQDSNSMIDKRRKARVKGGSGCDDPGDVAEHPECR
jgi:ferric-dicitrate binding protein FerR (iron transport regulator)